MRRRRFGCVTLILAVLVTAVLVIAAMAVLGPRLSQYFARLTDILTPPAPTTPGVRAFTTALLTQAPLETSQVSAPTSTLRPTAMPTPHPTRTPAPGLTTKPDAVVLVETLNLRGGPGTIYARVGVLHRGDPLDVASRTEAADWLSVIVPDGKAGWVAANLVQLNIPLNQVSVASNIPPPPVTPTPKATVPPRPTLTIDEQIAALAKGQHGQLPQPGSTGGVAAGGDAELTILNDTPYQLTVLIGAPNGVTVVVEPCPSCRVYQMIGPVSCQESGRSRQVVRIKPGTMQVAARVSDPSVVPFLGTWNLNGDTGYFNCFFIVTRRS